MSLLCWNYRGHGNPRTARELHHLVREKHPHFLFLIEMKVRSDYFKRIHIMCGFEGLFTVDPVGQNGGLTLF
jgi:hypothetical protein